MADEDKYIGKYIGEYRLEKILGMGTYGAVYLASQPSTGRFVAIKLLTVSQQSLDRFMNEVQALLLLRHEYIVPILGFDRENRYIVMEFAAHGSLKERIKSRISFSMALSIIKQIGLALHYAHQKFIVHRDLKPENILFNADDDSLLADLGIAMVLEGGDTTQVKFIEGTYAYMAPELFKGEVSLKSDQYALGCIAYELVTGKKPINPDIPPNADDIVKFDIWRNASTNDTPDPPSKHNTDLSAQRERAILKALSKERKDRYDNVYAFLVAMKLVVTEPLPESDMLKAATTLRDEGNNHYRNKRYSEALLAYDKSLDLTPDNAETYHLKGQVLRELKRYMEALHAYSKAVEISPNRDIFYNGMGNVLFDMGSYEEAAIVYDKAISLAPSKEFYYVSKGDAISEMKDYKGALYVYEEAIRRSTNNLILARAFARKGRMHFKLGDRQQAFRTFETAIARNPSDVTLYLEKGYLHWKSKQFEEARITYEQGLKFDPTNDELLDRLRSLKR